MVSLRLIKAERNKHNKLIMKQTRLIFSLVTALLLTQVSVTNAQRFFQQPFQKKHLPAKTQTTRDGKDISFDVVVDEDFSKFQAGSETAPDNTSITMEKYSINPAYTQKPGWTGDGVYQAGGTCYLGTYLYDNYPYYGYLTTPEMPLYGDVVITFRAKRAPKANSKTTLWVVVCDAYSGPVNSGMDAALDTEWKEFEYKTSDATFSETSVVQFAAYDGEVFVDDIKVQRAITKIETPYALPVINNSPTSFTASWNKVATASEYLLSVYYMDMPENSIAPVTVTEDFEGINVMEDGTTINKTNPNYPNGWKINVSSNGKKDMANEPGHFNSGKQAIYMDEVGDYIYTPVTPAPISSFSFWVKPSSMEYEEYPYSMLSLEVFADGQWYTVGNLPNYYFQDGGVYTTDIATLGVGVTQIKLSYIQKNKVAFAIDDITYTYSSQPVPYMIFEDQVVKDTFCVVNDINPEKETYYYVKSRNGQLISEKSYAVWVDGINGVKPTALAASNITENSFTANWQRIPNAQQYKVNASKSVKYEEGKKEQILLHETFDLITQGTVDNPSWSYEWTEMLAETGKAETDWILQLPQFANGMAGAQATNYWSGRAGLVVSPRMSLDCNEGTFDVDVKAYMTYPGDTLFVMLLNEYSDKQALAASIVPFDGTTAGPLEATTRFEKLGQKDVKVAFMSMYGQPFFIDEVTVRQKLNKGEETLVPYKTVFTEQPQYTFTGLDKGTSYTYDVQASANKDYIDYVSDVSNVIFVSLPTAIDGVNTAQARVFSANGNIYVQLPVATEINLYGTDGILLNKINGNAGLNTIPSFSQKGKLVIVKVGNESIKLIAR